MQLIRHWPGGLDLSRYLHWVEFADISGAEELNRIGKRDGIARA